MIQGIKSILKKVLFKGRTPKTFPPVRIQDGKIEERVFLRNGVNEMEISSSHAVVCHRPFLMVVWMESHSNPYSETCEAVIRNDEKISATAQLLFHEEIPCREGLLILFSIRRAHCYQLDFVRQLMILRYFKNKDTFLEGRIYAALYSYPRRVIVVSFRDQDYYNIFPMDFHCLIEKSGVALFGLRTTNFTIERIIQSKKVVISDSGSVGLETIYQLGRNHSQSPPLLKDLPFETVESERFHFPVPQNYACYREIEIIDHKKLGSHMLLVGKVIHSVKAKENEFSIHHLHFFQSIKTHYQPA